MIYKYIYIGRSLLIRNRLSREIRPGRCNHVGALGRLTKPRHPNILQKKNILSEYSSTNDEPIQHASSTLQPSTSILCSLVTLRRLRLADSGRRSTHLRSNSSSLASLYWSSISSLTMTPSTWLNASKKNSCNNSCGIVGGSGSLPGGRGEARAAVSL